MLNTIALVPVSARAATQCPRLEQALVPVKHPIRTSLNQKFRTQQRNPGEVNNVVRLGNYGVAYWWKRGSNGRYTSATPIAFKLKGNKLDQAVISVKFIDVLKSWGASPRTAECLNQILNESGI